MQIFTINNIYQFSVKNLNNLLKIIDMFYLPEHFTCTRLLAHYLFYELNITSHQNMKKCRRLAFQEISKTSNTAVNM